MALVHAAPRPPVRSSCDLSISPPSNFHQTKALVGLLQIRATYTLGPSISLPIHLPLTSRVPSYLRLVLIDQSIEVCSTPFASCCFPLSVRYVAKTSSDLFRDFRQGRRKMNFSASAAALLPLSQLGRGALFARQIVLEQKFFVWPLRIEQLA